MTLNATRFGTLEFEQSDVLVFNDGLIGFPNLNNFLLISLDNTSPFRWLQSVDDPAVAFLVAHPEHFFSDYAPVVSDAVATTLALDSNTPTLVFTTASIPPGKPHDLTLNLAGPLVLNAITRKGKQVVLDDELYTIKHRVFPEANRDSGQVAA
jgi:flagellar assembly factor FliW